MQRRSSIVNCVVTCGCHRVAACRDLVIFAVRDPVLASGCAPSLPGPVISQSAEGPSSSFSEAPAVPPVAGAPSDRAGVAIAAGRPADSDGMDGAQIDAMFEAAMAQAKPWAEKRAICVGMQGLADPTLANAPESTVGRLGGVFGLPAVPASHCSADIYPYVTDTGAEAVGSRTAWSLSFEASSTDV